MPTSNLSAPTPISLLQRAVMLALGSMLCLGLLGSPAPAQPAEQSWPQRPVRLILPFGPASGTDVVARLIANELTKRWGQPVVVDNRPGGDNLIAINAFLGAKDDHVFLFTSTSAFLAHPFVHKELSYDFERDFAPIAKVTDTILVTAVPASLEAKDMAQFIALARAQPDKINLAAATGLAEFAIDAFLRTEKLKNVRVPYKDLLGAARDLAEGRIHLFFTSYAMVRPFVEAGKVRVIGVAQGTPVLKDVPALPEAGHATLAMEASLALFGRPDMPLALRKRIADDVLAVMREPKIGERIVSIGQDLGPAGPEELVDVLKRQFRYAKTIAGLIGK